MKMKFTRSAVLAFPPTGQQGREGMQRGDVFWQEELEGEKISSGRGSRHLT